MISKTKVILLILVAILGIAVTAIYFTYLSATQQSQGPILSAAEIRTQQENMVADIVKQGNIGNCVRAKGIVINGIDYEKVCEYNVALDQAQKHSDLSSCDKVGEYDPASKMPCQLNIILTNVSLSDQDVCVTLSDSQLKSYCYVAYWREEGLCKSDIYICHKIDSPEGIANCRTNFYVDNLVFQKKK